MVIEECKRNKKEHGNGRIGTVSERALHVQMIYLQAMMN